MKTGPKPNPVCPKCGGPKTPRPSGTRNGKPRIALRCASCQRAASREWHAEHLQEARAKNKRWRCANKTYRQNYAAARRDRDNELLAIRRKKKPEIYLAIGVRWRQRHAEKLAAARKGSYAKNPEIGRYYAAMRRARVSGAAGSFGLTDLAKQYIAQAGLCANPYCRTDLSGGHTIDHVVPLIRGGSNYPENIQLLCGSCNSRKNRKTMQEWLAFLQTLNARGVAA